VKILYEGLTMPEDDQVVTEGQPEDVKTRKRQYQD
jgi:hypothetical protein